MKPFPMMMLLLLASCGGSGSPDIKVQDAWARATLTPTQPAAIYLKIVNSGQADDHLRAVESERGRASLHSSVVETGVARMRTLAGGVEVAAGETVEFQPHGMHIMLESFGEPLKAGSSFPLVLTFAKSGPRQVQVAVRADGGTTVQHEGH